MFVNQLQYKDIFPNGNKKYFWKLFFPFGILFSKYLTQMPDIQRITIVKNYFNLSQKDFSIRIGISPSKVSKVESGSQKISTEMVFAINREFNVSMEWLLGNAGHQSRIMFSNDFVPKEELEKERKEKEEQMKANAILMKQIIELQSDKIEKQEERIRERLLHT